MFDECERRYVERAPLARLATSDGEGHPSVVPVCFALHDDAIVTPIDEKPQDVAPTDLRRVRDVEANPHVALVVDHYAADWSDLGWVQIRGTASLVDPGEDADEERHTGGVTALRAKYDQCADHDLESRPQLRIDVGSVRSWGRTSHEQSEARPQRVHSDGVSDEHRGRAIRLIEEDDGWWSAVDQETGVASQGETRVEALEALDEAVSATSEAMDDDTPAEPDAPWFESE